MLLPSSPTTHCQEDSIWIKIIIYLHITVITVGIIYFYKFVVLKKFSKFGNGGQAHKSSAVAFDQLSTLFYKDKLFL